MRILHISNHIRKIGNGIVNVVIDLACLQAEAGHDVAVASLGGEYENLIAQCNVQHFRLDQTRKLTNIVNVVQTYRNIVNDFQPNIVHAHMLTGLALAKALRGRAGYGLVSTVHNEFQRSAVLMGLADRVIAVSEAVAQSMKQRGIPQQKIRVVRNGPLGSPRTRPLSEYKPLPLYRPAITTVAGMYRRKGVADLIDALPGADEAQIRLLLSSAIAVLLYQRQYLVLHASAIAIEGNVVAFVGEKGEGKSTMAATLYGRGHELVADDIVAVDMRDCLLVAPGFPQLKLWSDAVVSTLGQDPETLPRLDARYDKHARPVTERFCQTVLPLKRIYVLSEGTAPAIKPLEPQVALKQLFTHWYFASVADQLLKGESAALHLRQCATLINQIPVQGLERPRALSLLPQLAQLIETDNIEAIPVNNPVLLS